MKMILAILNKDDELETVEALNQASFFVTKLSTTGGFLKKKNATILIGTEDERVESAIGIIRAKAGKRSELRCAPSPLDTSGSLDMMALPMEVEVGGCTIFILPVDGIEKY